MKQKYIIIDDGFNDVIVVFPDIIQHSVIAGDHKVVGAGFIDMSNGKCYGNSYSLGVSSRPEDTKIALRQLFQRLFYPS